MKKLLIIFFCFTGFSALSQHQLYAKKFNGNKNAIYITNSTSKNDLAFLYSTPEDTSRAIYLIQNFKAADIELIDQKLRMYDVKILPANYVTQKGDLVYTVTSQNLFIYFYHKYDRNSVPEKSVYSEAS